MKIGLVQFSPVWEDKPANKDKILKLVDGINNPDLLVFPEMTLTGFTMNSGNFAEGILGDSFRFFSNIASKLNTNVFAGIIEKGKTRNFNTLLHITPNKKLVKLYRKIHPFSYSEEDKNYQAGANPAITKIKKWQIGLSICYDLRFPELYRKYGKRRTHLIVNIANWPHTRIEHWRTLLKARAIENQCYIAGVNRVGKDPKLDYPGFSSVFDPMGIEIIAIENEEKVNIVELNKDYVSEVREKLPFLEDIKLI
ncbi:MAG TPA: nitrilase-related carbon-nitrogen hydrolase [Ignavibacteriaceae bacterium]|nr:nitrilase-related carbon-nitrogen hydrolase [Ignavibacteriaceae bacterium]